MLLKIRQNQKLVTKFLIKQFSTLSVTQCYIVIILGDFGLGQLKIKNTDKIYLGKLISIAFVSFWHQLTDKPRGIVHGTVFKKIL